MENSKEITLFITSCNRPDLLQITLESFLEFNTYPIKEAIITEDSGNIGINDFAHIILPFPCKIIYNPTRIGQMKSIENASQYINTPYVFHCEEDWEFYDYGFIEKSFEILEKDPKVLTVFLRSYDDCGVEIDFTDKGGYFYTKQKYIPDPDRYAGVLTFNPGVRTTENEKKFMPYKETDDEGTLGFYFQKLGMFGAVTTNANGFIRHIGWDRHCW